MVGLEEIQLTVLLCYKSLSNGLEEKKPNSLIPLHQVPVHPAAP